MIDKQKQKPVKAHWKARETFKSFIDKHKNHIQCK